MGRLVLTKKQRDQLLDGARPKLAWPRSGHSTHPVEEGQEIVVVRDQLTVEIVRVGFTNAHWVVHEYRVRDFLPRLLGGRPRQRYGAAPRRPGMQRGKAITRDKEKWPHDDEVGYTHLPSLADDELETVDDDELARQRRQSDERWKDEEAEREKAEATRKQEERARKAEGTVAAILKDAENPEEAEALLAGLREMMEAA